MGKVKTVGVKELKNKLSAYLREVRSGNRILVTDHATVIAELREPYLRGATRDSMDALMLEWVNTGAISLPQIPKRRLPESPVKLKHETALSLLESDRTEGRE